MVAFNIFKLNHYGGGIMAEDCTQIIRECYPNTYKNMTFVVSYTDSHNNNPGSIRDTGDNIVRFNPFKRGRLVGSILVRIFCVDTQKWLWSNYYGAVTPNLFENMR